jgi:hypothetical protein
MGCETLKSNRFEIVDGRPEPAGCFYRRRTRLVTMWRTPQEPILRTHIVNSSASQVYRLRRAQQLRSTDEAPYSGWPEHFVSGKCQEIHSHFPESDASVRSRLGGVHHHASAGCSSEAADGG